MQLYPKPSDHLVFDLINTANSSLPIPLTGDVVRANPPVAIPTPPPAGPNTKMLVSAKFNKGYTGTRELSYNRINLSALFKGVEPIVRKYSANNYAGTIANRLDDFNALYGMKLSMSDIEDASFPISTTDPSDGKLTAVVNVVAKPTSPAFIGTFQLRWKQANQELNLVIKKEELPARTYPGGNVFDNSHLFVLNCDGYGDDYTEILATKVANLTLLDYFVAGLIVRQTNGPWLWTQHAFFVSEIARLTGTPYICTADDFLNTKYNLAGMEVDMVTLPSAAYPFANSVDFNRLMVFKPPVGSNWAVGTLYIHHNTGR